MAPMLKASFKGLFFMISCSLIVLKITFFFTSFSSTSKLIIIHSHGGDDDHFDMKQPLDQSAKILDPYISPRHQYDDVRVSHEEERLSTGNNTSGLPAGLAGNGAGISSEVSENISQVVVHEEGQTSTGGLRCSNGKLLNNKEVYHDKDIFSQNYKQMNKTFKIFVYPHAKTDPFANILLPDTHGSPGGNYASESYFKIALSKSHFITHDPSEADLFFLPFSIASMRHDKRIGVGGIKDFVKGYISRISHEYPFWNRTGGADHFYVACHSIGRTAMEKAPEVRINAIQVVCSSSYFLQGYNAHKDASIPQIWPRPEVPPIREPSKREMLAFYAGAMNSKVRESLVKTWINDPDIRVHQNRLKTPYSESLLGSKFCIHAKGFEVNTARIGDAIYYGCIPVVLADHYDLPFADILDWSSFSVIVSTEDIKFLKRILKESVDSNEYLKLQKNVLKVKNHFRWHENPVDFDAFYMVMYELWVRRSSIRINLFKTSD